MASRCLLFLTIASWAAAPAAIGQTVAPYVGEIVMTASGELTRDWKEVRVCKGSDQCQTAIINVKTHEGVRLGDKWSTKFEKTGNGKEVRRAETARDKAIRLKGAPPKP